MANLLCLGLGYCAEHFIVEFGAAFDRIIGTVTSAEKASRLVGRRFGERPIGALVFDGKELTAELHDALATVDALLVSVPPDENGDPVLAHADALPPTPHLSCIVYLSTIGVYGDHAGGWVDESTPATPLSARSVARLAAENAWRELGRQRDTPVAILRLSGIYGPGQSALRQVASGTAKRIVKPGQLFNRIHVADIAQAIEAAFARRADGIFNVSDDEPAPNADIIAFAAELLGVAPPPEIAFVEAAAKMSPLAASFYAENKRARNDRMKRGLGVRLRYPSYREGLRALHTAGDHLKL